MTNPVSQFINTIEKLRTDLSEASGPEQGTVIRFQLNRPAPRAGDVWSGEGEPPSHEPSVLTFAAVFADTKWFLSGQSTLLGKRVFAHDDFMAELARRKANGSVWGIATVAAWEHL